MGENFNLSLNSNLNRNPSVGGGSGVLVRFGNRRAGTVARISSLAHRNVHIREKVDGTHRDFKLENILVVPRRSLVIQLSYKNLSSYHYSLGKVGLDSKGFKVITEWNYAVGVF